MIVFVRTQTSERPSLVCVCSPVTLSSRYPLLLISAIIVGIHGLFLRRSPLESKYSDVSSSESCVAQSITEGVDGGIDVTEEVGYVPNDIRDDLKRKNFV